MRRLRMLKRGWLRFPPLPESPMTIDQLMPEPDEADELAALKRVMDEDDFEQYKVGAGWGVMVGSQLEDMRLIGRERARSHFVDRFSLARAFESQREAEEAAVAYHAEHGLEMVTVELRPGPGLGAVLRDSSVRLIPRAAAEEVWRQWWLDAKEGV